MIQALMIGLMATAAAVCPCENLVGDPSPPVITLNGYTPLYLRCNDEYVELGAKANSVCDGNLDERVIVDNSAVDTTVPGIYTVTYSVTDDCGTETTKNRIVEVLSDFEFEPLGSVYKEPYTLSGLSALADLLGIPLSDVQDLYDPDLAEYIEDVYITAWDCKQPYDDSGAFAYDECEGDLTSQIIVEGANDVLTGEPLTFYPVVYSIPNPPRDMDPQFRLRIVAIVDYIRPTISVTGKGYQAARPQDSGYTPPDDWWYPYLLARYERKYGSSQWFGDPIENPLPATLDLPSTGIWASSTVGVKEEWAADPMQWVCDKPEYIDPGAIAFDDCEGYLDPREMVVAITRSSTGNCGFPEGRERFVYVARLGDLDGDLIDTRCDASYVLEEPYDIYDIEQLLYDDFFIADTDDEYGLNFDEAASIYPALMMFDFYSMDDDANGLLEQYELEPECDGNPFPPLDFWPNCWHGYRVYYFMRDSFGNIVYTQTRIVEPFYGVGFTGIEGTTTVNCGDDFSPTEGVKAYDTCQGDITNRMVITGSVDTSTPATYELLYSALSNYGRYGQASRRIDVVDNTSPLIILLDEFGDPTDEPDIELPWCSWRIRAAGELYGLDWWNSLYWRHPYTGWGVYELCDDAERLTGEVGLGGGTDIREALEFLKNPRDQGVPVSEVNEYLGEYSLYHNLIDINGNYAPPTIRKVNIVSSSPRFTLNGDVLITHECGEEYTESGIAAIQDVLEGGTDNACYTGEIEEGKSYNPVYFKVSYKKVPPDVEPESIGFQPYIEGETVITIDEFVLGDNKIIYRATNPLGYSTDITRTVRVDDRYGPDLTAEFFGFEGEGPDENNVYQFDCLNVLETDVSEYLNINAIDSCDGDLIDEVESEVLRETQENGTGIYTVRLTVVDTGGNVVEIETPQFVSISTDDPSIDLGTWAGATEGPYSLYECASDFVEPDDFAALDGCGSDLGAPDGELSEDEPGVAVWAWALDETGEPLWEDVEGTLEPVVYSYEEFTAMPGDYLVVYTAYDLWDNTYPVLSTEDGLPPLFDGDGNLLVDESGNLEVDFARLVRVEDRTAPVITLSGNTSITINCGIPFLDPGFDAQDACDGDLTDGVVVGGDVLDVNELGAYIITYNVTDSAGNAAAQKTRTVIVEDSIIPTITLLGNTEIILECGIDMFEEPGVLASDGCVGDLTEMVEVGGDAVESGIVGDYTITYTVSDNDANQALVERIIHVVDTTPPVITLEQSQIINVECGFEYTDPGFVAADACSGDLSENVVVTGDAVDTAVLGSYAITYTVSDPADNTTESIRTVNVVDTTPPEITLPGDNPVNTPWGEPYSEPVGYTAVDACEGVLTNAIVVSGEDLVDTSVIGSYEVRYEVVDSKGNRAVEIRMVNVVDPSAPTITLIGDASLTLECASPFEDPGATATDEIDGDLTDDIVVKTDPNMSFVPGVYEVAYSVTNSRGSSSEAVRTVTVTDATAPALALRGASAISVDCGDPIFILDDYAFAEDLCDSTPEVSRIGTVDTDIPGVYTVQYTATDSAGNTAQTELTVTVRDNCPQVEEGETEGEDMEGEVEGEGEGEPEECTGCRACLGCCPDEEGKWLPKDWLGDWLLIGLSMLVLASFATSRRFR